MKTEKIAALRNSFDSISHLTEDGVEYWLARELQLEFGYNRWENFEVSIWRAMDSCNTTGVKCEDHFRETTKMITLGKGGQRAVRDYMLTRYACYLIAQNGDPQKEEIAFAQSYFAVQTRRQELIEDRINLIERMAARDRLRESEKKLSENI